MKKTNRRQRNATQRRLARLRSLLGESRVGEACFYAEIWAEEGWPGFHEAYEAIEDHRKDHSLWEGLGRFVGAIVAGGAKVLLEGEPPKSSRKPHSGSKRATVIDITPDGAADTSDK